MSDTTPTDQQQSAEAPPAASNPPARRTPGDLIKQYQGDFATVLPSHIKPDTWVRLAQGALKRNEKLEKAATANPGSLLSTLLEAARLGLEPGSEEFYLVPFGSEVTGIVGYQGEIELIYRAGAVSSIKAEVVYSRDVFRFDPSMETPDHRPDWFGDRGDMVGVYAYAAMVNGSTSRVVVLSKADVDRARAVSRSANSGDSPWKKWPEAMWRKTAIHELSKWVPTSAEYREAARRDAVASMQDLRRDRPRSVAQVDTDTGEVIDAEVVED